MKFPRWRRWLAESPPDPETPASTPQAAYGDPGAPQEPISHVAVVPMHWLPPGPGNTAACGWPLTEAAKWTIDPMRVHDCAGCAAAIAPELAEPQPDPEPAPLGDGRAVHLRTGTTAACKRPADEGHLTGDTTHPRMCGACKRTGAYKAATQRM